MSRLRHCLGGGGRDRWCERSVSSCAETPVRRRSRDAWCQFPTPSEKTSWIARAWQRFVARVRTSAPLPEDPHRDTKTSRKEQ